MIQSYSGRLATDFNSIISTVGHGTHLQPSLQPFLNFSGAYVPYSAMSTLTSSYAACHATNARQSALPISSGSCFAPPRTCSYRSCCPRLNSYF